MSMHKPRLKYVSWKEIVEISVKLAHEISKRYKPDVIVAVAKGGLVPARIMLDFLNVDEFGVVEVKFYKSIGFTMDKPFIRILALPPIADKNVLVVDDVVDTGRTMQLVVNTLSSYRVKNVKTVALFLKPWSTFMPDYYYSTSEDWIIFPWEICEVLRENVSLDNEEFNEYSKFCVEV
ncbi:MAG: phosphoribosyltransferase family protein [Desulfurococcaceae archaeon]